MENLKKVARKCAFCRMMVSDLGAALLSRLNQDNLTNWCEIVLKVDTKDVLNITKNAWVCRYCIWDARYKFLNLI